MTQAYAQILQSVQVVRRTWQNRRAMEGSLLTAAAPLALLAAAALLDRYAHFAPAGRWILALVVYGAALAALRMFVLRPLLTRHTDDFFAAMIESRQPALRNRLINALQLGRQSTEGAAPRLVDAIVADGVTASDEVDAGRAVASPAFARNSGLFAISAALMAGFCLAQGPAATPHIKRVLLPAADIAPFTYTFVSATPDSPLFLLEGTPLTINAKTTGATPTHATLTRIDAQGTRRGSRMTAIDSTSFMLTLPPVDSSFSFIISAGDAVTKPVSVTVEPRPRITAMSAEFTYPLYTALAPRSVKNFEGPIAALMNTQVTVTYTTNKPLSTLSLMLDSGEAISATPVSSASNTYSASMVIAKTDVYHLKLTDTLGNTVDDAARYAIVAEADAPPAIGFAKPGRDLAVKPGEGVAWNIVAQDDFGLSGVNLMSRIVRAGTQQNKDDNSSATVMQQWPLDDKSPIKRADLNLAKAVDQLDLKPGDRLEYWATASDRCPLPTGGVQTTTSRKYSITILTPEQVQQLMDRQLMEYSRVIADMIKLQRLSRSQAESNSPPQPIIERQAAIMKSGRDVASAMEANNFPAVSMIEELRRLASAEMPQIVKYMETARDASSLEAAKAASAASLPVQDKVIESLEEMLKRLNRDQEVRKELKRLEKEEPTVARDATAQLGKVLKDFEQFLVEQKDLKEKYEKLTKRNTDDDVNGEDLKALNEVKQQIDKWKQWAKDSVDGIAKLPTDLSKDTDLAETLPPIFEEVEKLARGKTEVLSTPLEEGMKAQQTEVLEDLEVWMYNKGDAVKFNMEELMEGKFEVPESKLPSNLQDVVGDLIEDVKEFDEEADDVTSSFGGNLAQAGWDIVDGPMGSYAAQGKTGNQLPNNNELSGRSGSGRRGKSSGSQAGDESTAMEGRPTPARVTDEPYQAGQPKADKQLDPRGATGGGKKTGAGMRGLQGGSKPDFMKDMARLTEEQKLLRERTQQIAQQLQNAGKSSTHVNRSLEMMQAAEQDMKDNRYEEAGRKRKSALNELRTERAQIDGVSVTLEKAPNLSPELRKEVTAGAQQALPEGYEDLVGEYYKAISNAGGSDAAPK